MRKIKSLLFSLVLAVVMIFGGFAVKMPVADASNFQLNYNEYSEKVQTILGEFCVFRERTAGSKVEKDAGTYIRDYLLTNATKVTAKNDASTEQGIQEFKFVSDYTGLYETSQNIIFEYKSSVKTNKKVILACNYDAPFKYDEETGDYVTYNNDALNVSAGGVAALMILAETLPNYNLGFNLEFVFFGAGESSFAGSDFYLNGLSSEDEKDVLCVINIDKVALGTNLYFYMDEVKTSFSKYVSSVVSSFTKEIDLSHLNKTEFVYNDLGLGYSHIALESDNVNFMKRGIATINLFAGDYETGIVLGRNEYNGKELISYTDNDTLEYINKNLGSEEIADNLYMVNSAIETLLNDANFERNAAKSYGKTNWFYKIFANEELVLWLTIVAFVVVLIVSMYIYNKLTFKSYYANVEVEFLSSVVKISDHVEKGPESKEVAKVIGQVLANDIKKNKTLKPEKKKKEKNKDKE
jgi:hypothetical protein